jgi:sortase A
VARLQVPAHGVDLIVLTGVSGRTLAFGPGHAPGSAVPGAHGTAIVTGHRDTHFRFLERVKQGDEIIVEGPNRRRSRLRVQATSVVEFAHRGDSDRGLVGQSGPGDLLSVRRRQARGPATLRGDGKRIERMRPPALSDSCDIKRSGSILFSEER